jgi:hypothetical protein
VWASGVLAGLALDVAPSPLLGGDTVTLADYQRHSDSFNMTRFLWRTQVSAATAKGATDDDKSVRLALGVRVVPWDLGDPRLDSSRLDKSIVKDKRKPHLIDCLKAVAQEVGSKPQKPVEEATTPEAKAALEQQIKDKEQQIMTGSQVCRNDAEKRLWNNSSFSLGAAPSWISKDGTVDHVTWNGGAVWASLAYGFEQVPGLEDRAQLILHARYRTNEQVPDPKAQGKFFEQNSVTAGARLRTMVSIMDIDRFGLSVEGLWSHENPVDRRSSNSTRVTTGLDIRLTKEVWLEFSIGGEGGRRHGNNQTFALGILKCGSTKEPRFINDLPK